MKRFAILLLALSGCYDPSTPPPDYRWKAADADSINPGPPIPPCLPSTDCKLITRGGPGLQIVKCVVSFGPGCPDPYSYLVIQANQWQEACWHVPLDGGEGWYGSCDQ